MSPDARYARIVRVQVESNMMTEHIACNENHPAEPAPSAITLMWFNVSLEVKVGFSSALQPA